MRASPPNRSALLVTLLVSSVCLAQTTTLSRADKAFDELEFDQAASLYRQALKQPGTMEERAHAWRGLGLSQAFLGEPAAARKSFEVLLLIDPEATVKSSLGPKIARPFQAARKSARRKRPELQVTRNEETGAIRATLDADVAPIERLVLRVRPERGQTLVETGRSPGPIQVEVSPNVDVEVWVSAQDAQEGTLMQAGTEQSPLSFKAPARPAAVASAVEDANAQRRLTEELEAPELQPTEPEGMATWPLWVGGAVVVVGGGVAAAVMLSQPQSVNLPPAQRTGRLP